MTDAPKISLAQQIEAAHLAVNRQRALATSGRVQELRPRNVATYDIERLAAAVRTLEWLKANMDAVREFAAMKPDIRMAALKAARDMAERNGA